MSYQYKNRHNSVGGNWYLPPPQSSGLVGTGNDNVNGLRPEGNLMRDYLQQQQSMQGFRNPWFSPANVNSNSIPSSGVHSHSPTRTLQGVSLLPQSKRTSFANQLPTTYEYDDQTNNLPPFIHPPTRADNPFNQYYTSQEVTFDGPDRRMSAAVDNLPGGGALNSFQTNPSIADYYSGYRNAHIALPNNARRASTTFAPGVDRMNYYQTGANIRSPLIVLYNQYQQFLNAQRSTEKRKPAPRAQKIYNTLDLKPKIHNQPKYRRCSVNSIHISPVNALSVYLTDSFSICQPKKFQYSKSSNPKRVLTKPLEPKYNSGYDNEDSDYILYVNDILGAEEGRKYIVLDLLGSGTFGQVVKCQNLTYQTVCAVKVIKSKPAYMNQSLTEVKILEYLNSNSDGTHFIKLLDTFMHKEHLCLVFELLSSNLYELIKQNQFQGLNTKLVRIIARQLLESLAQLKNFQMIHCDLKPENILLCQTDKPDVKVIDFGSACFTRQTIYSYIQSRFYRSPEIILGLPYTESIDMWSLGCIVGELFLGLPMFPGTSEYNQIWKIVDMLGEPLRHMLELGRNITNFFNKLPPKSPDGKPVYKIKSYDEYMYFLTHTKGKEPQAKKEQKNKNYFKKRHLKDIILNYKLPSKKMTNSMIEKECQDRVLLVDFLTKVLNLNPLERLTPQEALRHPFVNDLASATPPRTANFSSPKLNQNISRFNDDSNKPFGSTGRPSS